jgi:REP element-mobilizing transposase RayT
MEYNPAIHHRRSIRLTGYDYSQRGYYFITVCTQGRQCRFGEIEKGRMILNDAGEMVGHWWNGLKNKYAKIEIDGYVVMPNHCHGIINVVGAGTGGPVCPPLRVCPDNDSGEPACPPLRVGTAVGAGTGGPACPPLCVCPDNDSGEHMKNGMGRYGRSCVSAPVCRGRPIYEMIRWFKTMTTNEYIRNVKQNRWEPFDGRLWQRNYYEQIVRDEISLQRVREYIVNNPCQWQQDKLFEE